MSEHQLVVVAGPAPDVPARIVSLALPTGVVIHNMQFCRQSDPELWWIQLAVRTSSDHLLELLTKRLNRLVDVNRVVVVGRNGHRRQSVYVSLRPKNSDLFHVCELARLFHAETLELSSRGVVLHLTATPDRCADFVSMLRSHGIVDVMMSAVTGFRSGAPSISRAARAVARA